MHTYFDLTLKKSQMIGTNLHIPSYPKWPFGITWDKYQSIVYKTAAREKHKDISKY
jgi:hypothetical protein